MEPTKVSNNLHFSEVGNHKLLLCFLRNTATEAPREAIGPLSRSNWTEGVQLLLGGVNYVGHLKTLS